MAILIERQVPWHVGFQQATNHLTGITTHELHVGWVAVLWFSGSLRAMVDRWTAAQDDAVRARAARWHAADVAGAPEAAEPP